jgi:hypothetical protein
MFDGEHGSGFLTRGFFVLASPFTILSFSVLKTRVDTRSDLYLLFIS